MIKIIQAYYVQKKFYDCIFRIILTGDFDLQLLIDKGAELVLPLNDEVFFKGFFLELGALCWKNGLELCPDSIYQKLSKNNQLHFEIKAA